ncbi:tetratricopeptide repeat protein [bacterium]|nr:tetratricopeptide repeat protein [candidate division CSSED10-310 bacterium]
MDVKKLILIVILIIGWSCVSAYHVEGIIKDYDDSPLQDAMVRLLDVQRFEKGKDFTDRTGTYKINGIAGGQYTMEITKTGMKKVEKDVYIGGPVYDSTVYVDVNLDEIVRFESVKESEIKSLYMADTSNIPRGAYSAYIHGLKEMDQKDWDDALKEFSKAIKKYPDFSRCYSHIGDIYRQKGSFLESEENYLRAIELNPNDPYPQGGIGSLYIEHKEWDKAIHSLSIACTMDPSRAELRFLFGKALVQVNRTDEAERQLLQGLMMQPRQTGDTRIILANLYIEQGRLTDARSMLTGYLSENPFAENKKEIRRRIEELDQRIAIYKLPDME